MMGHFETLGEQSIHTTLTLGDIGTNHEFAVDPHVVDRGKLLYGVIRQERKSSVEKKPMKDSPSCYTGTTPWAT